MTSNKRKLSELSNNEEPDAVVQLEKRLNAEFDRAYGAKAAELQKAHDDMLAALAALESCKEIASRPHKAALDYAKTLRICAEFDEKYGTAEAPSYAFRDRHPELFGSRDHRSDAKKEKDAKFRDRDAATVAQLERRAQALVQLNSRVYRRVVEFNTAVIMLRSNSLTRPLSGDAVQCIDFRPHK